MKLLIIARRINSQCPEAVGGVIVSSENLIKYLDKTKISYELVNTNKTIYKNKFTSLVSIVYSSIKKAKGCDHAAMNLNENELVLVAPVLVFFYKLLNISSSLRIFGGNVNQLYKKSLIHKILLSYVFKNVSTVFLQTNYLMNYFSEFNATVKLPTCRYVVRNYKKRTYQKKFVFISHIKTQKGVEVILNAFKRLDNSYSLDFYGVLQGYEVNQLETKNTTYKGVLKADEVSETLKNYDFLLLPTFHEGEGYPGVIIEAYSMGVPVISTQWRSIPEIVDDGETGILIEPNNYKELVKAVFSINEEKYQNMRSRAFEKFDEFDCDNVYSFYLKQIEKCI